MGDQLPGADIEFALGDGDDDFAAHDLALHVSVGVVFAGAVMLVLRRRFVRGEFLQPDVVVVQETVLSIVDVNGGGGMRCPFAIYASRLCVAPVRTIGSPPKPLQKPPGRSESTSGGAG